MLLMLLIALSVSMLSIALLVLIKNPKSRLHRSFGLFLVSGAGWLLANYFAGETTLPRELLIYIDRSVMALPALCLVALLFFILLTTDTLQRLSRIQIRLILAISTFVILGSCTPLLVEDVITSESSNQIVFGPLAIVYIVFVAVIFVSVILLLVIKVRHETSVARLRLKYLLVSLGASIAVSLLCNLILPLVFNNYSLVQAGPLSTIIVVAGFTYAIIKHRMFDIRLVVAKSLAYVLLIGTIGLLYSGLIVLVAAAAFGRHVGPYEILSQSVIALLLLFTFQPLRRLFEKLTNNIFYRQRYDSQEVLNAFSKILVSEIDLDRLLKRSLTALCESMHIAYAQIVVFNHDRVYRVEHYGVLPKRLMVAPELVQLNQSMVIADELEGGKRKEILEHHDLRVSTMLRTSEEFVGYLLIGDKLSGDVYSDQDIKVLEIISRQLAVALQNAKAFAEIKEFNITLQGRVEHATKRLRVANRHLKELDEAKDEFISMASHQLRTPLTTIKGYLSMLQEGDAGKLTSMQNQFVGYGFDASQRMVNLISDLLNVSRLSAGRFIIQQTPTDVVKMVTDEVRQLHSHAEAKAINLVFDPPVEAWPLVSIDDNKTRQVVMNFIDNAIFYTQKGEVRVLLSRTPKAVKFEVHDTGIGVPRAAQSKLFSKFFRAENAQSVRPDGTGLGLYLAKRVVEDQGGTLIFSSTEGKGSIFGFELPAAVAKPVKQGGIHGRTTKSRAHSTHR